MAHTINPNTHSGGRGSRISVCVSGQPDLHNKFQASHRYLMRHCFKKIFKGTQCQREIKECQPGRESAPSKP